MTQLHKSIDFDRVAEFFDLYVDAKYDIDFWRSVARSSKGPCLELMCGTGRLTLPLLKDDVDVEGLDYSARLLTACRRKIEREGLFTLLHHADARRFALGRSYDLIFIGCHSIAEVIEDVDKALLFEAVREHLEPGGQFWLSIQNPRTRVEQLDGQTVDLGHYTLVETAERVGVSGFYSVDRRSGVASGVQVYECMRGDKPTRRIELPVSFHLIEPARLESLLESEGFAIETRFGDYDRSSFHPDTSPYFIVGCRLRS